MDLTQIPIIGKLFEMSRDFAAEGILQRVVVYGVWYLVAVLLAGLLVKALGWYTYLGIGGTLLVGILFFVVALIGIDPENEYTKADVIALFVLALIMPVIVWALAAASTAAVAQVASPLVLMADAAAAKAAEGVATPAASALAQYLGNVMMHSGALFFAMGLKYVITE